MSSFRGFDMGILSWIVFGGLAGLVASFLLGGGGGIIFDIIVPSMAGYPTPQVPHYESSGLGNRA